MESRAQRIVDRGRERVIRPSPGWISIDLRSLWERRGLLFFLTLRDLKLRYKQTFLGALWVVLQPISVMAVFSVVFGLFAKMPSEGLPYPVYYFCALVPWQFVANVFGDASISLIANQNLITKVNFPRLILPLSVVLARLIDFILCLIILLLIIMYYRLPIPQSAYTLPIFVLLAAMNGLGVGLWVATLTVKYRDVRQVIPFLTQLWFFASPIVYSVSVIPEKWHSIYSLNPMVGIIDGFRWALLQRGAGLSTSIISTSAVAFTVLVTGLYYFRRRERGIADIV
jgi:lipopolysaccharide transport system permease protein